MAPRHWLTGGAVAAVCGLLLLTLTPTASAQSGSGQGYAHAGSPPGKTATSTATSTSTSTATSTTSGTATAPVTVGGVTYPITGIDVSSHDHDNGHSPDWPTLAANGVTFAYVKATEYYDSTGYINPYFAADYQAARDAGLYVGAYTYARPDRDPIAGADQFVNTMKWAKDSKTLIPMVDIEWPWDSANFTTTYKNCYDKSPAQVVSWLKSFLGRVEARIGRKAMIYTNRYWWSECTSDSTSFAVYPMDIANYDSTVQPTLPTGWFGYALWQYAPGNISVSNVHDRNVFNGDMAAFATMTATPPPVISLRARADSKFVCADNGGSTPMIANRGFVGYWEQYDEIDFGDGTVGLRAHANGKYVSAGDTGGSSLIADQVFAGPSEHFVESTNEDGTISLQSPVNGMYVTAENRGTEPLIANRTSVGSWEKFDRVLPPRTISIKAKVNGRYVTAESAGTKPLIANRSAVGLWERFDEYRLAGGLVGLRSRANGKWVNAPSGGSSSLIANGTYLGAGELYTEVVDPNTGTVAFQAWVNGNYVTAESAGKLPLIANRGAIGLWESFYVTAVAG
jgi:GH25 family lysozyme M1 (1,4-beta-N-acetylmuramidase)